MPPVAGYMPRGGGSRFFPGTRTIPVPGRVAPRTYSPSGEKSGNPNTQTVEGLTGSTAGRVVNVVTWSASRVFPAALGLVPVDRRPGRVLSDRRRLW